MLADIDVHVALQDHGRASTFEAKGNAYNVYQIVSQANWENALDKAVKDLVSNFQQQMAVTCGPSQRRCNRGRGVMGTLQWLA